MTVTILQMVIKMTITEYGISNDHLLADVKVKNDHFNLMKNAIKQ